MSKLGDQLDQMPNVQPRVYKGGDKAGQRKRGTSKADEISTKLAEANTPSALAAIASKVGITDEEILARAVSAPNFGQFRMVLGNRIRGIYSRFLKAQKAGLKTTMAELAAKGQRKPGTGKKSAKRAAAKESAVVAEPKEPAAKAKKSAKKPAAAKAKKPAAAKEPTASPLPKSSAVSVDSFPV